MQTIKIRHRDSNMELLRIISMAMIVFLHFDLFVLIESNLYKESNIVSFYATYIKSLTIISVNAFIFLSGWYGIHFKWKRFGGLWFQILFFQLIGFICTILYYNTISVGNAINRLLLTTGQEYGFFQSYIILYLFSPMLNQFIENSNKKTITILLSVFYLIQFLWGCLSWGYVYFGNGYSALSFMGLYLLARFIRINNIGATIKSYQWLLCYLIMSITSSILAIFGGHIGSALAFSYASPIVITSAFAFVSLFSKVKLYSKLVNTISQYCFAVYLFHMNSCIKPMLFNACSPFMQDTLEKFIFFAITFCIIIFIISISLDFCRLYLWNKLSLLFTKEK